MGKLKHDIDIIISDNTFWQRIEIIVDKISTKKIWLRYILGDMQSVKDFSTFKLPNFHYSLIEWEYYMLIIININSMSYW